MRPSWLTAPEKWPLSQDICSHKLPRPQGWKTHTPFFTTPILSINTMSQTRRNLFFTTMEASSECRSADTNSCLRAGWLYTTLKRCMCAASEKARHPAVILPHRIWFTWQKRLMCWCGTVSICMMQAPFCIAVTWISFYTATTRNFAGNTQSLWCGFNMITMFKFRMLVLKTIIFIMG